MTSGNTIEVEIQLNLMVSGTHNINNIFRSNIDYGFQESYRCSTDGTHHPSFCRHFGLLMLGWFLLAPGINENRTVKAVWMMDNKYCSVCCQVKSVTSTSIWKTEEIMVITLFSSGRIDKRHTFSSGYSGDFTYYIFNSMDYIHVSGISTELSMKGRILDINLNSSAS